MEKSFHRRVRDENLRDQNGRDENARDENVRHENLCSEADFSDWDCGAGIICGSMRRREWHIYSYADADSNTAGHLFACELERYICLFDERHR